MSDKVAVFRKRLLSYSETFIADQGRMLPRFEPVFCGFHRDPSGIDLLGESRRVLLDECEALPVLGKLSFRLNLPFQSAWLNAIRQQQPQLIHAHFFNDGLDALRLGKRLDKPVITTLHGHDITKQPLDTRTGSGPARLFAGVHRVIAVSRFIADQALRRGCPENKLVQHYIGIDVEKFTDLKQETAHPSLLFVGRLVEKKGCTYLLQAMARLQDRFPELSLTIVGDGDLKAALQEEARARGLRVEFAGVETALQIRQRLARCWLFVAPSITAEDGDAEGLGMVFLEAQALQTPVVSFRSGGVVEAVDDSVTGLLSEEKDVASLAENIRQLLDNSSLRHEMGEQGRKRVEALFDLRKQCALLEDIYREAG